MVYSKQCLPNTVYRISSTAVLDMSNSEMHLDADLNAFQKANIDCPKKCLDSNQFKTSAASSTTGSIVELFGLIRQSLKIRVRPNQ